MHSLKFQNSCFIIPPYFRLIYEYYDGILIVNQIGNRIQYVYYHTTLFTHMQFHKFNNW